MRICHIRIFCLLFEQAWSEPVPAFFAAIYSKDAIPVERQDCFKLEKLKMKTCPLHGVDMSRSDR